MAIFGAYETTEELERTAFSVVFRATQAYAKTRSPFVIKTLDLDATAVDPQTLDAKNQQFLSAVRTQQKISDRSGTCHWAPVHDLGTVRGRAFYVTDCYPRTVAGMIKGRVKVSARALYSVIRGIIKGLQELNQLCRRPHGNLKTSNVLIADPDLDPTEVYLSDPCSDEQLPAENADAADMKALGRLIYQLVTHRAFPEVGGWPIQPSNDWQRLGRRGKDWLAFCNQLLDPLTEKPMNLEGAAAAVKKLGAPPILSGKHVMGAAIAACVAVGAFGIYKFIQRGWTIANHAVAQSQPEDSTPANVQQKPPPPADPLIAEIQNHRSEIEKRIPVLEGSRDPLLARFASLLQPATTQPLVESNRRLAELDALSSELVIAVSKEYQSVDRGYFNQQAGVHQETKNKTSLAVEDFGRWLKEVKDPQYIRLDEKLDPRKGWQPIAALRATKLRLDELQQIKPGAADVHQPQVQKLNDAITNTRQRRWNNAQKPLIEAEMKEIDGRLATLAANIDSAINAQQGADAKLGQLRAKLTANAIILTDDSLQAQWEKSRTEILQALKKDPGQLDALSKKTTDVQARLTAVDQGIADAAKLLKTNDFVPAIAKLDDLLRTYPDDGTVRERRSSLAVPLYDRGMKFLKGDKVNADQNEAFRCFILAAGLGEARAARMLGRIAPEIGTASKDSPALLDLFKKSADTNDAAAMNIVGFMLENGWGAAADPKAAVDWYTKSANGGFGGAMNNLGFIYYSGKGVAQDNKKAFDWFSKGGAAGYAASMKNLGTMYQNGHGVKADGAEAAKWYRKAADANDASAMTRLGILYEEGKSITRDFAESAKWYGKAAEAGEGRAMLGMGNLLENGLGVDRNEAEAFKWTSKAADAKEPSALRALGLMYADGRGTAKDAKKGAELLKRAADAGDA